MNNELKTSSTSISTSNTSKGSLAGENLTDSQFEKMDGPGGGILARDQSTLYETALFNRFGRWRYPMGYGARFPDFVFDGIPYFDLLLSDLGLPSWRKGWGWLGELFVGSYGQADYRGLVSEWIKSQSKR